MLALRPAMRRVHRRTALYREAILVQGSQTTRTSLLPHWIIALNIRELVHEQVVPRCYKEPFGQQPIRKAHSLLGYKNVEEGAHSIVALKLIIGNPMEV